MPRCQANGSVEQFIVLSCASAGKIHNSGRPGAATRERKLEAPTVREWGGPDELRNRYTEENVG